MLDFVASQAVLVASIVAALGALWASLATSQSATKRAARIAFAGALVSAFASGIVNHFDSLARNELQAKTEEIARLNEEMNQWQTGGDS